MGDPVPPNEFITNENMEVFLATCWECGNKPNVLQGKKYLNHILTSHGRPNVNRDHRQEYASVLDFLNGLRQEERWQDWATEGAEPLTQEMTKKILRSTIFNLDGSVNMLKLRNKVIALCLLTMGWRPADVKRVKDINVIDLPHFRDRDTKHRPKLLFNDLTKTKQNWKRVKNTVGCGCPNDRDHDPRDERCFYTAFKAYMRLKDTADERASQKLKKFNKVARARHFDEAGHLTADKSFFRCFQAGDCGRA